jgi:hypothetical protein
MMTLKPPKALSRKSKAIWAELTELHHFEAHELVTFERALQWWDVSDAAFEGAMQAEGKQRADLLKLSLDASNAALRCWRTLKFPAPAGARRPGRPSGADWSPMRKAAAMKAAG